MKIPKRFKLLGQTVEVVFVDDLTHGTENTGEAVYRKNEIRIQASTTSYPRPACQIEHTFYHELMHWILFYAGQYYKPTASHLHSDEYLVDVAGGLLHQAMTTAEYD